MRFPTLLQELHRRHVFKAGVAYLVVSWLIVQVLDVMIPAFTLPDELMPFSIVVLLVCFPIWLGISWFYDLTDDGVVRTKNIGEASEKVSTKSVNLNKLIITSLSVIVILLIVNTFRMKAENKNRMGPAGNELVTQADGLQTPQFKTSVAVLAFADMTPRQDHEYFGDSMSEEIINRLCQIKDLKVIGRTSSFSYKNRDVTHHIISEELDVDYILEGSIRVSRDIIRITAQLINAQDGSHVWSQAFDRNFEDVLFTQDEIAKIVADRLEVSLLSEDVRLRKVDPEAFNYYLQANNALRGYSESSTVLADSLIRLSLDIDQNYAPSWAVLSQVIFRKTFHYFHMEPKAGFIQGTEAAKKAIELNTRSAVGYTWLSHFEWQNKRADLAEQYLNTALEILPNDPAILFQAGKFALRTNRLENAKRYLDKAILLDPKNDVAYYTRSFLNWTMGRLDEADKDLLKAYSFNLADQYKNYEMALLSRDHGKFDEAILWMEKEESSFLRLLLKCSIDFAMGKKAESLEILEQIKNHPNNEDLQMVLDTEAELNFEIACLYAFMEDTDNAFAYLDKSFEHILIWPERLFTTPEFNKLRGDPRWETFLIRLGVVFNYEFLPFEKG